MIRYVTAFVLGTILTSQAFAQTLNGTQDFVRLTGDMDNKSRIAGFNFNGFYYIAGNQGQNGSSSPHTPTLWYGQVNAVGSSVPTPNFQDATAISIPNLPTDYHITHFAAGVVNDAPYLFQFKCKRSGNPSILSATYEKVVPPVLASGNNTIIKGATFTIPSTVSSTITQATGNVFDVAAAELHSKLYLFILSGTGSKPTRITVWSYAGQGSGGPVLESNYNFNGTDDTMQGLDATNVTLASGDQAIIVTAAYVASGKARVNAWQFNGDANGQNVALNPYSLANPPYAQFPAAVRIAYGPANGLQKINSATLFYVAVRKTIFSNTAKLYSTQLSLPASPTTGSLSQVGSWTQQSGIWTNTYDPSYTQYPFDWTAFPVSITPPNKAANSYTTAYQYITLVEKGQYQLLRERNSFVSALALELVPESGNTDIMWNSGSWYGTSTADQLAAVESWTLLGVITGIPPLPYNQKVTYTRPILTVGYSTATGASQQTNYTKVVTAKAYVKDNITSSTAYSNSARTGSTSSTVNTIGVTLGYPSSVTSGDYNDDVDLGYLIVSEPTFLTGTFDVYAYDGTTELGIFQEAISVNGTNVVSIPFSLTDPTTPPPHGAGPDCVYASFPLNAAKTAAAVTYWETDNFTGWATNPQPAQTHAIFPETLGVTASTSNTGQLSLASTGSKTFSDSTSNTITLSDGVDFLGTGVKVNSSFTTTTQSLTSFSTGTSTQITYPLLTGTLGYSSISSQVYFDKINTGTILPPWMPSIFAGSQPWILSWKVTNVVPYNTGTTTGNGSTPPGGKDCRPGRRF